MVADHFPLAFFLTENVSRADGNDLRFAIHHIGAFLQVVHYSDLRPGINLDILRLVPPSFCPAW